MMGIMPDTDSPILQPEDTEPPVLRPQILVERSNRSHRAASSEASLSDSDGAKSEPEDIVSLKTRLMQGQEARSRGEDAMLRSGEDAMLRLDGMGPSLSAVDSSKKTAGVLSPNLLVQTSQCEVRLPRFTTPGGTVKVGSDARGELPLPPPRPCPIEQLRPTPAVMKTGQPRRPSQGSSKLEGYAQSSMAFLAADTMWKPHSNSQKKAEHDSSGIDTRSPAPRALSSSSSSSGHSPRQNHKDDVGNQDVALLSSQSPMKVPHTSLAFSGHGVNNVRSDTVPSGQHSPMKVPCASTELHTFVQDLVQYVCVRPEDTEMRKQCIYQINQAVQQFGRSWRVSAFGSAVNGFGSRFSDLDVALYSVNLVQDQSSLAQLKLKLLQSLREHPDFTVIEEGWSVQKPLARLKFQDTLDVRLSSQAAEPLLSSHLLQAYAKMVETTVRHFIILVKLWAKAEEVCGERYGYLSSYCFTLMAIYFLQVDDMTQMPCLPVGSFSRTPQMQTENLVRWTCPLPLPTLLVRFFTFFATLFQWDSEVVSIRTGRRTSLDNAVYCQLRTCQSLSNLQIEDPYALEKNLGSGLAQVQSATLYTKFVEAAGALNYGRIPAGLEAAWEAQNRWKASPS